MNEQTVLDRQMLDALRVLLGLDPLYGGEP
jgi:hypothetical protein